MKIKSARLENFMLFDNFDMTWSPNINVICGSNSTGKTVLIKYMYALLKAWRDTDTEKENKERVNADFVDKLTGVFRPENKLIGRLVQRKQGNSRCACGIYFDDYDSAIEAGFGSQAKSRMARR